MFKKKNPLSMGKKNLNWGIASGIAQSLFIGLVALFMNAIQGFGSEPLGGYITSFLFFLLFFVLCAVISAGLVFGRPIYLIIDKNFHEAILTLLSTILTLMIITFLVLFVVFICV
ncbi:MAG: hypothetical protein ABIF17_02855 [Patescibacteria group bacterium]